MSRLLLCILALAFAAAPARAEDPKDDKKPTQPIAGRDAQVEQTKRAQAPVVLDHAGALHHRDVAAHSLALSLPLSLRVKMRYSRISSSR